MSILGSLELEHPLMNAAGTCKSLEDVQRFVRSDVSAILVGSITMEERQGNEGNVYFKSPHFSLNALGMPNRGAMYYKVVLPEMVRIAHAAGKPLGVSVAGFNTDEYGQLSELCLGSGVDFIELNLGCPNIWDGGVQKRIVSFDPMSVANVLSTVEADFPTDVTLGVKLSPYSDPELLRDVASIIADEPSPVRYVATSNTFPNGFAFDGTGHSAIGVQRAGVSGGAMKAIGMGQVDQFREYLPVSIALVGVGGIFGGQDVADYLHIGAASVQVSTAYWNANEGAAVFGRILAEYMELVS